MRHRTPRPRPLSLFCVNTDGACVRLTLALAASTIARALAMRTPVGASVIASASSTSAAQPGVIVSS